MWIVYYVERGYVALLLPCSCAAFSLVHVRPLQSHFRSDHVTRNELTAMQKIEAQELRKPCSKCCSHE